MAEEEEWKELLSRQVEIGKKLRAKRAESTNGIQMRSPNERLAEWYGRLSEQYLLRVEWMFGDLDQPVTDILWMVGMKFLKDYSDQY